MPPLENPKLELYAQELAKGTPVREAFIAAGFTYNAGNAYTRKNDERVQKRIEELLNERAKIHTQAVVQAVQAKQVTIESILDDLSRALAGAERDADWKAMVAAATSQARVAGLMVERHLVKAQHELVHDGMSDGDLNETVIDVLLRRCAELGLDPEACTLAEYIDAMRADAATEVDDLEPVNNGPLSPQRVQIGRRVKLPKVMNGAPNVNPADINRRR